MARFSLSLGPSRGWMFTGCVALFGLSTSLRAQAPMMEMAPAAAKPAPPPAVTNAPPALPPDTLGRYGKILAPGDQPSYPLKLKMPFPSVGEIKVPSPDELNMRDKLEQLAQLSDAEIRTQLSQWPAYAKMNLRDEGLMLQRIQDFRDYRSAVAMRKAHDMGLLTLTPQQKVRFEKDYWTKRLQMEHEISKQFGPIMAAREQKMQGELFREFSSATAGPVAQIPAPVTAKKRVPAPALVAAQNQTLSAASVAPATNMAQPMEPVAQAPR